MGSLRRSLFFGLASALLGTALAPTPGRCGDGDAPKGVVRDGVLTLQAEQSFTGGSSSRGAIPISVAIANRGGDQDAVLQTTSQPNYNSVDRTYCRTVHLAGDGAVTHVTIYPSIRGYAEKFEVRLISSGGHHVTATVPISVYDTQYHSMALLSDRLGALSPVANHASAGASDNNSNDPNRYVNVYVKPENAPDRVAGYESLTTLVLGAGAERLSAPQWRAIRAWVVSGGELIVLGQEGWKEAGAGFADLSPERVNEAAQTRETQVPAERFVGAVADRGGDGYRKTAAPYLGLAATAITGTLAPDAVAMPTPDDLPAGSLASRRFGTGSVLYCAIDLTARPLRTAAVGSVWQELASLSTTFTSYPRYENGPATEETWKQGVGANASETGSDPFRMALPRLTDIVYVFATFFVFAVPITFVVLKRTRRMNLAWFTGPILAVAFAGVLYLFSARLYLAPLSRRTTGSLFAASGDRTARFTGYTEMFFPHAGSYDVTVPHSDRTELFPTSDYGWSYANNGASLETTDDGETVQSPDFGVANLAFRRLYHTEDVAWGNGITANLHRIAGQGGFQSGFYDREAIAGTITNGTGMTLRHVFIEVKGSSGQPSQMVAPIAVLPPGTMTLPPTAMRNLGHTGSMTATPMLIAYADGEAIGPQMGKDVSGKETINVVVSLPALTAEKN